MAGQNDLNQRQGSDNVPYSLQTLNDKQLGQLYNLAPIRRLKSGEYLLREGELGQTFYVILNGLISVVKETGAGQREIAVLSEGDWVGEIAFTRQVPRTASAVAKTPVSVMTLDRTLVNSLDHETQAFFFQQLNEIAAERIVDLAERERDLAGQNLKLVDYIRATRSPGRIDYKNSEMIKGIIKQIPRLPSFAGDLVHKLLEEEITPQEIGETIKEDRALSALVLNRINSPVYGFKNKVTDIHQALVALGFNEVYLLVVAEGIRRTMPDNPVFRQILDQSTAVSRISHVISQITRVSRPMEAATIGLFHNIGLGVVNMLKEKNPHLALLIDTLDAPQMGAMLVKDWGLPEIMPSTMEFQSYPEFSPSPMIPENLRLNVALLFIARLCEKTMAGRVEDQPPAVFFPDYLRLLGWESLVIEEIVDSRVLPALLKRIGTFPLHFRKLIVRYKKSNLPDM
jgi:HD-like signal output (HDOD) protein